MRQAGCGLAFTYNIVIANIVYGVWHAQKRSGGGLILPKQHPHHRGGEREHDRYDHDGDLVRRCEGL